MEDPDEHLQACPDHGVEYCQARKPAEVFETGMTLEEFTCRTAPLAPTPEEPEEAPEEAQEEQAQEEEAEEEEAPEEAVSSAHVPHIDYSNYESALPTFWSKRTCLVLLLYDTVVYAVQYACLGRHEP